MHPSSLTHHFPLYNVTQKVLTKHIMSLVFLVNEKHDTKISNKLQQKHQTNLTACSHCRHGQDKTVLSCPCGDKTRQFCLVSIQFPICNCSISNILRITEDLEIGNWVATRQNCLVLSAVVFTPPTRTRQDNLVLSVSAV